MAVVVKKGSPKPDISTPEAFKQTLLNAKTIAYSNPANGGASGVYFAKLLERMGIADQMRSARIQSRRKAPTRWIRFLHTPEAAAVFKAKGITSAAASKAS